MKKETLVKHSLIYINIAFLFIVFIKCYKITSVNILLVLAMLIVVSAINYFYDKINISYKKVLLSSLLILIGTIIYSLVLGVNNIVNILVEVDKNFLINDYISFNDIPLIIFMIIFAVINIYVFLINKGKGFIINIINFTIMMTIWFTGYTITTREVLYFFCILTIINFTLGSADGNLRKEKLILVMIISIVSITVISNIDIDFIGKHRYDLQSVVDTLMGKNKVKNQIAGLSDNDKVELGGKLRLDNKKLFEVEIDEPTYLKTNCYYKYSNGLWEKTIGDIDDIIIYKGIEKDGNDSEKEDYALRANKSLDKILGKYKGDFYSDENGNCIYYPMGEAESVIVEESNKSYIDNDGELITLSHKFNKKYPNGYYEDEKGEQHPYDETWVEKYPRGFYVDRDGEPHEYNKQWYIDYPDGFLVDENFNPHPKLNLYPRDYNKNYYSNGFQLKEYKVKYDDIYTTIWPHPLNLREVYSGYKSEGINLLINRYIDDFNTNLMSNNSYIEDMENYEGEFVGDYFKSSENLEYLDNAISSGFKVNYDDVYWKTSNISPKVVDLANKIIGNETDDLKKVQKIRDYLRENYQYSLDVTSLGKGEDFLEKFLFQEKKGYCTYFATATTIMCRAVGVPARYVEGVKLGEKVGEGEYIARNSDAHAWCEVLLDVDAKGGLWTIVESTPGYSNDSEKITKDDSKEINSNTVNNDVEKNNDSSVVKENKKVDATKVVNNKNNNKYIDIVFIILFFIIAFLLLMILKNVYIIRRTKKSKDINVVYSYYIHRLRKYGIKKENYETGEEYLNKIYDKDLRKCVEVLLKTYNINMFSEKNILFDAGEYVILLEEHLKKKEKYHKYIIKKFFDISWRIT
ncbi:putative membrane protein [Clostridium bornimense]|uniref:Putative membrane protein n=1 Tax=Clostridium bornimense TaxID=1216932 RepID=W6SEP3_9CLOT|nr:transglutaminase-like domain-containing protein [Clostridium bornimense]CDM68140.1 putative membrane protein [Clostridium bornimense]